MIVVIKIIPKLSMHLELLVGKNNKCIVQDQQLHKTVQVGYTLIYNAYTCTRPIKKKLHISITTRHH